MKVLIINAHPDYNNPARTINKLEKHSIEMINKLAPEDEIEELELYNPKNNIPEISAETLNHPEIVEPIQDKLINQWKRSDLILIMMPLHNFNVVTKLKDYIDNIFIAKKTFKYTAEGSVGLLDGHQKVAYIQSSGSDYEHDLKYVNADFAPNYIRTIMNFMGIIQMKLIRAQGMDLVGSNRSAIVEKAMQEITHYLTDALARDEVPEGSVTK
ncbi:FMN-dependent NADH-azoreductase [Companilactobacillus ginsenosidimutans]|uniref:FMN dependent NADH:quinone oxidoreductase n=1 Tax=Companilactobacillus ginsenosidimutans TaxID=1007676 RepID=A0A0H4QG05_9LACO|nr:NAD(P)H-dependent oxidoreductase [Companilactobacillus ginsenosidimutans]AKP67349.1 hypothetical protein ABM34_07215 [Companilactobacillus ginsenosidimutans]